MNEVDHDITFVHLLSFSSHPSINQEKKEKLKASKKIKHEKLDIEKTDSIKNNYSETKKSWTNK